METCNEQVFKGSIYFIQSVYGLTVANLKLNSAELLICSTVPQAVSNYIIFK